MNGSSTSKLVFRLSLANRAFILVCAIFFVAAVPLLYAGLSAGKLTAEAPLFLGVYEIVIGLPLGSTFFYASGPNDLFVDLDRRTYRLVYGWLFAPTDKTGLLDEDFAGITVHCRQMNSVYQVRLLWKSARGPRPNVWFHMGTFNRSGQADRFAAEQATTLNLPLIETSGSMLQ